MNKFRIFVEKRTAYRVEAQSLLNELNENLSLALTAVRLINVYDLFGFDRTLLEQSKYTIFGERVTDIVSEQCDLTGCPYLAIECLPGQFDQRAASAVDCVHLIDPNAAVNIRSARLFVFRPGEVTDSQLDAIRHYCINTVECREKDLSKLEPAGQADIKPLDQLTHFTEMGPDEAQQFCRERGLAMNADDLNEVIRYFRQERRNPTETELRILDTYWSDHCRHTTFTTELQRITVDDSFVKDEIEASLHLFTEMRHELGREEKKLCLMELATIGARYLRHKGMLDDWEQSEENNACSIYIDVDVDGRTEKWLLQFKNETHNHPTEIEPFGGAATCLGGAIRDPLSGRAYVYQAMRVTGAGDIYKPVADTLPGKLPQRIISRKAAAGYSCYGNQIGLATTHVREIYHPDYTAKRLETGAVVGAVKADQVRRESPVAGDVVLLLGGRTGRDGIGGATGSSKKHETASLESCGSEVQKGNAPEERKLQRLFRRPEVARMIKKANDFGAGGVSVAIGELADGLDIYLDRVPTKYAGLNATELAISESQERMAVVVEGRDKDAFIQYCRTDNVEVTYVADVTDSGRMRLWHHGQRVADLSREFIDSAGARHYAQAAVLPVENKNPFRRTIAGDTLQERLCSLLADPNVTSQKGLIEHFDATIGRSTVLMPFGGKYQQTETQVSMQKLPTEGYTDTASVMAFGYNPYIACWSPYHAAAYAVVEACTKVVAAGADWSHMRFSYQEYFERMTTDPHSWGKPLSALLGALKMQYALGLPSIGGKDSMSGTFEHINVPPTLIAFGITTLNASKALSPELKQAGNRLYLIKHKPLDNYMPNTERLKSNWTWLHEQIQQGTIVSAYAVGFGGVAEAVCKMAFGNALGADITLDEQELFDWQYGSVLVESTKALDYADAMLLGRVTNDTIPQVTINGQSAALSDLLRACGAPYERVYPATAHPQHDVLQPTDIVTPVSDTPSYAKHTVTKPIVCLPVFPGTNCDYDTAKAFRRAGAEVRPIIFRNLTGEDVLNSIETLSVAIDQCHILMFAGGFSAGDEPDGSGKFIANVILNTHIAGSIERLIRRGGLILGICNGFQALIKSGLLPFGHIGDITEECPTLFRNDINRHVSQMVTTRVCTTRSPWLDGFREGDLHTIAVSHGEGKFTVSEAMARQLFNNGQVAFRYADPDTGEATMQSPYNPNGSCYAIEGIISPNGQILGKMGHSERYEKNVFRNIAGNKEQDIFANAVRYFTKSEQ